LLSPAAPITARRLFGLSAGDPAPSIRIARRAAEAAWTVGGAMAESAEEVRLETDRLSLRPWRTSDYEALHRIFSDPAMFRFSHRGPMSSEESWSLLLRQIGHWAAFGHGVFAVIEKASGALIGEAGPGEFRRGLGPDFDPFPEMTWSILPDAQGNGYAAEAAAAALAWARGEMGVRRTVCLIHTGNEASLRVATGLGYRPTRELDYRGYPARLFERGDETRRN
jgi:RimJ/RimL family protein N-acetyltransferase